MRARANGWVLLSQARESWLAGWVSAWGKPGVREWIILRPGVLHIFMLVVSLIARYILTSAQRLRLRVYYGAPNVNHHLLRPMRARSCTLSGCFNFYHIFRQ